MEPKETLRLIGLASSLSFVLAGSIAAGFLVGQYLERRLGGDGIITVLFILLGILAGFYNVYRVVKGRE